MLNDTELNNLPSHHYYNYTEAFFVHYGNPHGIPPSADAYQLKPPRCFICALLYSHPTPITILNPRNQSPKHETPTEQRQKTFAATNEYFLDCNGFTSAENVNQRTRMKGIRY